MKNKTFKGFWIIQDCNSNNQLIHTIRFTKKQCIKDFISNICSWDEARKKYGWECVKVNLTLEFV